MTSDKLPDAIRVGIAVVLSPQGRIVVGVRGPKSPLPGYAEFPGGKCHAEESPTECAVRECHEETGLHPRVDDVLHEMEFNYDHARVKLTFVLCHVDDDTQPLSGTFYWCDPSELDRLKFPEANAAVLPAIHDRIARLVPPAESSPRHIIEK